MLDDDRITGGISRLQFINLGKTAKYFFRNQQCLGFSLLFFQGKLTGYYNKFIAAKTGDGINFTNASAEPPGQLDQQKITDIVAMRIIEFLEMIQIKSHQSTISHTPLTERDRLGQAVIKQPAIRQTR